MPEWWSALWLSSQMRFGGETSHIRKQLFLRKKKNTDLACVGNFADIAEARIREAVNNVLSELRPFRTGWNSVLG